MSPLSSGTLPTSTLPLRNPVNDSRAIASALKKGGFSVIRVENAALRSLDKAVRRFGEQARDSDVALFFYSGHGLQVNGINYLQPIGADIRREQDVQFEAFNTEKVLGELEAGNQRVNIVIIDACRNNPASRSFRAAQRGLAQPRVQPTGTIIAFSTAPGSLAYDGKGDYSPYVTELYHAILEPNLKIEDAFKKVRAGVMKRTQRLEKPQVPWENSSLLGDFYFSGQSTSTSSVVEAPAPSSGDFSLSDLESEADKDETTRKAWGLQLQKM